MMTPEAIRDHEYRSRCINHCVEYIRELLGLLDEMTLDHRMRPGIVTAISETQKTLGRLGVRLEF